MTEQIRAILVDDEPRNLRLTEAMLKEYCPEIIVTGSAESAEDALRLIRQLTPQLVFMDVEMPYQSGFDVLRQLEPLAFEVIFITAYSQYALEAFEYHAVGYLTKPVDPEKLVHNVNVAMNRIREKQVSRNLFSLLEQSAGAASGHEEKIALATQQGMVFVQQDEICHCESSGNYTNFYLISGRQMLVSRQLGEYEKLLPSRNFIRIHDKYIINLRYLREYMKGSGGSVLMENGSELPVATRRKEELMQRFEKWLKRKN